MDESATTALATLLGAATGGLTSVLATWLTHRTQARAQWLEQDALRPSVPLGAMIEIPSAALMAETIADVRNRFGRTQTVVHSRRRKC